MDGMWKRREGVRGGVRPLLMLRRPRADSTQKSGTGTGFKALIPKKGEKG